MANIYLKTDSTEFFPTPQQVKDDLYAMIPDDVYYILDPCCGDGGLEVPGNQYDYTLYDLVDRSGGKFHVNIGDFLTDVSYAPAPNGEKFDAVVMNPPFGLTEEFVQKSYMFSDDIYMIAPFKSVLKNHKDEVVDLKYDWRYPGYFGGIRVPIGVMHLHKGGGFNRNGSAYAKFINGKLSKDRTFAATFYETMEAPNKWFIVNRLTLSRVERGHRLIQDIDIYEPGDDSAFIALAANINTKKGDKIPRRIMTFNSYEAAKAFQKKYDDNADYVRNYVYAYGSNVLTLSMIPLL